MESINNLRISWEQLPQFTKVTIITTLLLSFIFFLTLALNPLYFLFLVIFCIILFNPFLTNNQKVIGLITLIILYFIYCIVNITVISKSSSSDKKSTSLKVSNQQQQQQLSSLNTSSDNSFPANLENSLNIILNGTIDQQKKLKKLLFFKMYDILCKSKLAFIDENFVSIDAINDIDDKMLDNFITTLMNDIKLLYPDLNDEKELIDYKTKLNTIQMMDKPDEQSMITLRNKIALLETTMKQDALKTENMNLIFQGFLYRFMTNINISNALKMDYLVSFFLIHSMLINNNQNQQISYITTTKELMIPKLESIHQYLGITKSTTKIIDLKNILYNFLINDKFYKDIEKSEQEIFNEMTNKYFSNEAINNTINSYKKIKLILGYELKCGN